MGPCRALLRWGLVALGSCPGCVCEGHPRCHKELWCSQPDPSTFPWMLTPAWCTHSRAEFLARGLELDRFRAGLASQGVSGTVHTSPGQIRGWRCCSPPARCWEHPCPRGEVAVPCVPQGLLGFVCISLGPPCAPSPAGPPGAVWNLRGSSFPTGSTQALTPSPGWNLLLAPPQPPGKDSSSPQ